MSTDPTVQLYYWPFLQGRGEFVRLILEAAGVAYTDVARLPEEQGGGVQALQAQMYGQGDSPHIFAPPFIRYNDETISQMPLICAFLAEEHGLIGDDPKERRRAMQMMLTIADFVSEIHDTHHPIAKSKYYEDQTRESLKCAEEFRTIRAPRFAALFERLVSSSPHNTLISASITYVDIALAHTLDGFEYAFPNTFARVVQDTPALLDLRARVHRLPNIAAYLSSNRRIPFNEHGIFRHYPALDAEPS